MRVEDIPIVAGLLLVLVGASVIWDAVGPQTIGPMRDRRRRRRAQIDFKGELIAGIGIALLGVALVGRDWRFETVTVLLGTICVLAGAVRNHRYFREVLLFRGAARRGADSAPEAKPRDPAIKTRIR